MIDFDQPIDLGQVKAIVREILEKGELILGPHCQKRQAERVIENGDIINVLRGGSFRGPEWENGSWRYTAETRNLAVVFVLDSETRCIVITSFWRKTP